MKDSTESVKIESLDLKSMNFLEERKNELLRLFPDVRTEGGKIDFDRLKAAVGEFVDLGRERYSLIWPGKEECIRTIQSPSVGTLLPLQNQSLQFNESENVLIEGDNLEVLKVLQKSYFNQVKLIFIDPPYNTGNDFIYPDNFSESLQTYLQFTGQMDAEGRKFGTNTEADGRFHSKWLNMMYPRLFLARNLLRNDGVIFITIDNQEVANLTKICNEIFGEENLVANVIWQKKVSPANDAKWFSSDHDYLLIYARDKQNWRPKKLERNASQLEYYKNPDNDPRGPWNSATYTCNKSKDERPNLYYPIKNPNTNEEIWPKETAVWKFSKEITDRYIQENRLYWGSDGKGKFPRAKLFLNEMDKVVPRSVWSYDDVGHTQEATTELAELFGSIPFDSPKPTRLIKRILELSTTSDGSDIVLDFFAGSGTTAQAVLEANAADSGNRKFILVQLPEPTNLKEYVTIAEITKERIRKAIGRLTPSTSNTINNYGFKVFKLAESNFKLWNAEKPTDSSNLGVQLSLHVDHIKHDRSENDILFEILLKSGFQLTTKIETKNHCEQTVYSIAGGMLLVCLSDNLTLDLIKHIAEQKPERVVCLDQGFANNDQLKANAVQIFRTKGIASFKTV